MYIKSLYIYYYFSISKVSNAVGGKIIQNDEFKIRGKKFPMLIGKIFAIKKFSYNSLEKI